MKRIFKRRSVKFFIMMFMCMSLFVAFESVEAQAATKKTKAKKAYASFLENHQRIVISDDDFYNAGYSLDNKTYVNSFATCDLNKDKIPELITITPVNFRWFIVRIYSYKNNKVTALKNEQGMRFELDDCATANGGYDFYICKKNHIHNQYSGYWDSMEEIFKVKKLKAKKTMSCSSSRKTLKYYTNTKKNRKKLKKGKI